MLQLPFDGVLLNGLVNGFESLMALRERCRSVNSSEKSNLNFIQMPHIRLWLFTASLILIWQVIGDRRNGHHPILTFRLFKKDEKTLKSNRSLFIRNSCYLALTYALHEAQCLSLRVWVSEFEAQSLKLRIWVSKWSSVFDLTAGSCRISYARCFHQMQK